MKRYIVVFLLMFASLNSKIINFEEQHYISSLDQSKFKKGRLDIREDSIGLSYDNSDKIYTFYDDHISMQDKNETKKINYGDKIELDLFAKLIKLIYAKDKNGIDQYFSFVNDADLIILEPKEQLSKYIEKIEYKKLEDRLIYLRISFKNGEWIKIDQY